MGAIAYAANTRKVVLRHMTMIDNVHGFSGHVANAEKDYNTLTVQISSNRIYGETASPDCPQKGEGGFCTKVSKYGLSSPVITYKGKKAQITHTSNAPFERIDSEPTWGGRVLLNNNRFYSFNGKTRYGRRQTAMALNPTASDYIPLQQFTNTRFHDVQAGALAYFQSPPKWWARLADCGQFPCTGPLNILYAFKGTRFTGSRPSVTKDTFQLIANNPGFAPYVKDCAADSDMNGYACTARSLGLLLFESGDDDKYSRSMQPIYVRKQGTAMNNKLNSFMDHAWDGFYTS
jgi:hypothetical protein